jgi:membrane-associated phospholipid phosphatase
MFIQRCFSKILIIILLALLCGNVFAESPKGNTPPNSISSFSKHFILHNDSIHQLNFRYPDKKRGIKPFIAPALLIAGGTALHLSDNLQPNFQDWVQKNTNYSGNAAEYLPYAPLVAVYSLNAFGIKGKNNFGNRTALITKSYILNAVLVKGLKSWTNTERPNGESKSFPSGHTSVAFAMAHFMHKEYGEQSTWYSIGAYACATSVAALRVMKNSHYIGDVVAGAGIGMLSTELVYLTHLYKWDNQHLKNFDIFPFQLGKQKGVTLVYNF